jgi:5-(carboxyamino)imidazole ribonucleotide mutase
MKPRIAILVGSKSDLPIIEKGINILKKLDVPTDITITSAHRSLKHTIKIVERYEKTGIEVFIVCAGLSAHLPGVVAGLTNLPVIGVPIGSSVVKGLDSLLSIVQMPTGIPVATVGINSVSNACLLAIEILALKDKELKSKIKNYRKGLVKDILNDNKNLKKRFSQEK